MDDISGRMAEALAAPSGIPLELASLVSPYRDHKQIAVRVEGLHPRARLSAGRNNGDRTWSLTLSDLDGLVYQPPDGMDESHTLAVRIIKLDDGNAITLAVLDVPVSPGDAQPGPALGEAASPGSATDETAKESADARVPASEERLAELSGQLEKALDDAAAAEASHAREIAELQDGHGEALKAQAAEADARLAQELERRLSEARATWESALAETWQERERARAEEVRQTIQAELAAARRAWGVELEEHLAKAAAESQATLEKIRAAWRAEQENRLTESEARARERFEQAQERWRREADAALTKAEEAWKTNEAARLAAAEAKWREQSARAVAEATARTQRAEAAVAEARAEVEALRDRGDDAEIRRLRDELATMHAAVSDRETKLAEARSETERERERWRAETQAALQKAEEAWKANEADGTTAAEAQWREQSAWALAEATARSERAEAALAEARAELEALRDRGDEVEIRRLRDELATMHAAVSDRETELAQARSETERARERWRAEAQAALQMAEEAWKANEAARLAAAEAQWREQSARALAEATARSERAEAAVAEARAELEVLRDRGDEVEIRRLRDEVDSTQAALFDCQTELARAQSEIDRARERWREETQAALEKAKQIWVVEEAKRLSTPSEREEHAPAGHPRRAAKEAVKRDRRGRGARRLWRGVVFAASLAAAVVFLPRVDPTIIDPWRPKLVMIKTEIEDILRDFGVMAPSQPPEAARAPKRHAVIGVPVANVRAGPSTESDVLTTLPRAMEVTPVERRGNWVLVRFGGDNGAQKQEGWVYGSLLTVEAGR